MDFSSRYPQAQHALAPLNNLVWGLIRLCHFDYVPSVRRFSHAKLPLALQLVSCYDFATALGTSGRVIA